MTDPANTKNHAAHHQPVATPWGIPPAGKHDVVSGNIPNGEGVRIMEVFVNGREPRLVYLSPKFRIPDSK